MATKSTIEEEAGPGAAEQSADEKKEPCASDEAHGPTIEKKAEDNRRTVSYIISFLAQLSFFWNRVRDLLSSSQISPHLLIIIAVSLASQAVTFYQIVKKEKSKDWEDNFLYLTNFGSAGLAVILAFTYWLGLQKSGIIAAVCAIAVLSSFAGFVLAGFKLAKAMISRDDLKAAIPPFFHRKKNKKEAGQ